MRNAKSNKGFTLIELLIVIAIIGILAAVLIPNLLGARARANDTAAQSYLREAITQQEIHQIDNNTYANTNALLAMPSAAPANVTLTVVGANATTYCMTAVHANGNSTFAATPSAGVYAVTAATPVCTAP